MPELPEVETVRRKLNSHLQGKRIISLKVYHNNVFLNQDVEKVCLDIKNEVINDIKRIGKWLIFDLDNYYLFSHLRMEGKYLYRNIGEMREKHELVIFNIDDEFELRYRDVRKFGKMYLVKKSDYDTFLEKLNLGLEPWDDKLTVDYLKKKFNTKKPIKTLLLDQSIICGIGNIYADEILFLSGVDPRRSGNTLSDKELSLIISNTRDVLSKAIDLGGTTIRSYTSEEGVSGNFQNELFVHQRKDEKCRLCDSTIQKIVVGTRGTYYCPKHQK